MKRVLDLATVVVLTAVGIGLLIRVARPSAHQARVTDTVPAAAVTDTSPTAAAFREALFDARQLGLSMGDTAAPVNIVVFADYGCGHCAELSRTLLDLLQRLPNHVQVTELAFPLTPSVGVHNMHLAAACVAAGGNFTRFQMVAGLAPTLAGLRAGWKTAIRQAGLPLTPELIRCVETRHYAGILRRQRALAERLGVTGTPTLFIGEQRIVGTPPLNDLIETVALVLGRTS
jgi:protein-disulfide isomerase